jgi:hypothetical protein
VINGAKYDWEGVEIRMPHGLAVDVSKIEYSDEKDQKAVYGKGPMARGYGRGNYKAEGKVTFLREEYQRLLDYVRTHGGLFYKIRPFEITVSFANEDQVTRTDVLHQCMFTKRGFSAEQGSEKTEVELDIQIFGGITTDGVAADANA